MPDVVVPEMHQYNCSYVSSVDLPSDSLREKLACWAVTRRSLKNHKTVKIGGWALARVWALAWDNTVVVVLVEVVVLVLVVVVVVVVVKASPSEPHTAKLHCKMHVYVCRFACISNLHMY